MNPGLNKLTSREVRLAIKRGKTLDSLVKKYKCTEGELRSRIKCLFTTESTAHSVWRRLVASGTKRPSSNRKANENREPDFGSVQDRLRKRRGRTVFK